MNTPPPSPPGGRRRPEAIDRQLRDWDHMARRLRVISVVLGLAAIVLSILVASDLLSDDVRRGCAVGAAVATATLTGLNVTAKSNGTRSAWRLLNAEVMRFECGVEADTAKATAALINAYEQAETLVGDISVVATQPPR